MKSLNAITVNMQLLPIGNKLTAIGNVKVIGGTLTVALHFVLSSDLICWSVFMTFRIEQGSSCDQYWLPTRDGYKEPSRNKDIPLDCFPNRCDISFLM